MLVERAEVGDAQRPWRRSMVTWRRARRRPARGSDGRTGARTRAAGRAGARHHSLAGGPRTLSALPAGAARATAAGRPQRRRAAPRERRPMIAAAALALASTLAAAVASAAPGHAAPGATPAATPAFELVARVQSAPGVNPACLRAAVTGFLAGRGIPVQWPAADTPPRERASARRLSLEINLDQPGARRPHVHRRNRADCPQRRELALEHGLDRDRLRVGRRCHRGVRAGDDVGAHRLFPRPRPRPVRSRAGPRRTRRARRTRRRPCT